MFVVLDGGNEMFSRLNSCDLKVSVNELVDFISE